MIICCAFFPFLDVVKEIKLGPDEYISNLTDLNCLKFILVAKVVETKKVYVDETKFQLFNQDSIKIQVSQYYLTFVSRCVTVVVVVVIAVVPAVIVAVLFLQL